MLLVLQPVPCAIAFLQVGMDGQVLPAAVAVVLLGAHAVLSDAVPFLTACLPHAPPDPEASQSDAALRVSQGCSIMYFVGRLKQLQQQSLLHVLGGRVSMIVQDTPDQLDYNRELVTVGKLCFSTSVMSFVCCLGA